MTSAYLWKHVSAPCLMLVLEHLWLNCTSWYFRSFFSQKRWHTIFFLSYTALCSSHLRLMSCLLTSDSSWDSSVHGSHESCGLTFSCTYRLYITDLHGQCLLLFGWECDLNECEVCCGFKQGNSQEKEGRLEVLEMSARVGFWVLIGGCSYNGLTQPSLSLKKLQNLCCKAVVQSFDEEGVWRCAMHLCCTNSLRNIHLINQCTVVLCRS